MPDIQAFFDPPTGTVTYLVIDPTTRTAALIDPVLDYEPNGARLRSATVDAILDGAAAQGITIAWALETHVHADHLSAADHIRRKTGARIGIGAGITHVQRTFKPIFGASDVSTDGAAFDRLLEDGDVIELGASTMHVMATPGHTLSCVTFVIDDAAFVGDTLFMPDYGTARTDFPGGDATMLYRSIRRILDLPPQTRIFTGHDYPPANRPTPAWESTVAEQRATNVHIHDGVSEADFVAMRQTRDRTLMPPRLLLPSLQVNIRAGALPPADADGRIYFKVPVTQVS
ncbi:MAG: MBL fold metallo-hydrolase [Alphaproteobacteria bacterium]|nr:MBL fold metallo-hydrolase [Alphaproteobacteria bacterium]